MRIRTFLISTTALVSCGLMFCALPARANPLGGQVVGGSATISGQGTANVVVNQQSQNAIVNWHTFNIGAGERTQFVQPNSTSIILNRVTGGEGPSQIMGTIDANGRVFLVNRDGIIFGAGSQINTAGFLATTSDIRNDDFMAGRYNFSIPGRPDASIVNHGNITASNAGFAALVAPGVRNTGTITAALGTIGLAAGNTFSLDFYGDKLITLGVGDAIASQVKDISTGQTLKSLVTNTGKLSANGGRVEITAAAARTIVDSVINTSGVIEANSVGVKNGQIVLSAATAGTKGAGAPKQTVKISGTVSAAGKTAGTKGGKIKVTGENIEVANARIDASGRSGGGTVMIGGDWGGGTPDKSLTNNQSAVLDSQAVPTAATLSVDANSTIDASAKDSGNGGKVILWSDVKTTFTGTILALGGQQFGNGGFVETSSKGQLNFLGNVDTRAPNGQFGTLLLDPADYYIVATAGTAPAGASEITNTTLQGQLANGNVIIATNMASNPSGQNGDIFVNAPVTWSYTGTSGSLTLSAYRNIEVNANITHTGYNTITLRADNTGTGVGTVTFGTSVTATAYSGVTIYYNPSDNPAGSVVNGTSYTSPTDYSAHVPYGLNAYMLVNTVFDLQNVQNNLAGKYAQGRDIDAYDAQFWNPAPGEYGFQPIGSSANPFTGKYDGLGHVITGLRLFREFHFTPTGLFAVTGVNSNLSNIRLIDVLALGGSVAGALVGENHGTIEGSSSDGRVHGDDNVGGLVGINHGTISRSSSTAMTGEPFEAPTPPPGYPTRTYDNIGGLVGANYGTVTQSYATGDVTGQGKIGGLVGINEGTISQSYASGNVSGNDMVGGLVGWNNSSGIISYAYALGDVFSHVNMAFVGGLIGLNDGSADNTYASGLVSSSSSGAVMGGLIGYGLNGTITNSFWDTGTTGQSNALGVGTAGTNVAGLSTLDARAKESNYVGWDFANMWFMIEGSTRPFLRSEYSTTITNTHQLQLMAMNPSAHYKLANDVDFGWSFANEADMWAPSGFAPIANLTGSLDGQNNTIDGLVLAPTSGAVWNIGLFGTIAIGAEVKNLTLSNVEVLANESIALNWSLYMGNQVPSGVQYLGAVAGQNAGTITNVHVTSGTVNGTDGDWVVAGGIAGASTGTISNSSSGANVVVGDSGVNSYSGVDYVAKNYAGGIVGGNVYGGSISNSSASGTIAGGIHAMVGGLAGFNDSSISGSSTTNTSIVAGSLDSEVGGLVGRNNNGGTIDNSTAEGAVGGIGFSVGGFVGTNFGSVTNSTSTGVVTLAGPSTPGEYVSIGGFVGENNGTITNSHVTNTAAVVATYANSANAGGFVGANNGTITGSDTYAAVSVGAGSAAGGFAGYNGDQIASSHAYGNVTGGGGSFLGGFVGGNLDTIQNSTASGTVMSTGANSVVGGFAAFNDRFSAIQNSSSSGTVIGTSDSYLGGLVGYNYGLIQDSPSSSNVIGSGGNNIVGGLVGLNFGVIDPSNPTGNVSSGPGGFIGSVVGANGALQFPTGGPIIGVIDQPPSPNPGTVNGGAGPQVGNLFPTSGVPNAPAEPTCNSGAFCGGTLYNPFPGGIPQDPGQTNDNINSPLLNIANNLVNDSWTDKKEESGVYSQDQQGAPGGAPGSSGGAGGGQTGSTPGNAGRPPQNSVPPAGLGALPSGMPPLNETRFASNEVVVQLGLNLTPEQVAAYAREFGLEVISSHTIALLGRTVYRFRITGGLSVREAIAGLQSKGATISAQPSYSYELSQPTNRPATQGDSAQYIVPKLSLVEAHGIATGRNVKIAVIDSEIDGDHPDLAGVVTGTFDALPSSDQRPHPHGTGMAGAIGSHQRLLGVAPGAHILGIRAFGVSDNGAQGTSMNIVKGLEWAVSQGAQIINMSFAGPKDPILEQAIKSLRDKGIILIAAAGNAGPKSPPLFPAADANVIAVSATDSDDKTYTGAVRGRHVAIAAPGVDILVPAPEGGYQLTTGTSVAAAHISGVVALMLERNPRLTAAEVRNILSATAKKLPQPRTDTGAGLVDPMQALSKSGPRQAQAR